MLEAMPATLFAEWQAYHEGTGDTDDQQNAATISSAIVNEIRELRTVVEKFIGYKQHDKPTRADDYIRRYRKPSRKQSGVRIQTPQEQLAIVRRHSGG